MKIKCVPGWRNWASIGLWSVCHAGNWVVANDWNPHRPACFTHKRHCSRCNSINPPSMRICLRSWHCKACSSVLEHIGFDLTGRGVSGIYRHYPQAAGITHRLAANPRRTGLVTTVYHLNQWPIVRLLAGLLLQAVFGCLFIGPKIPKTLNKPCA